MERSAENIHSYIFSPDFQGYSDRNLVWVLVVISDFTWNASVRCLPLSGCSGIRHLFDSSEVLKHWSCMQRININLMLLLLWILNFLYLIFFFDFLGFFSLFFSLRILAHLYHLQSIFIIDWNVKIPNVEGRCFYSQVFVDLCSDTFL